MADIFNYTYHSKWAFWLFVSIPILIALYWYNRRKKIDSVTLPTTEFIKPNRWLYFLKPFFFSLKLIALSLFIVALARPQIHKNSDKIIQHEVEGIDIIIALDISNSMLATDFTPNRLEASKKVGVEFIKQRKNDRIGLVVYGSEAFTQCPLTTDYNMVIELFNNVKNGTVEGGTAIGYGLATAINRLKESETKSKVIILLSDGENTHGNMHPITAAQIAKELGIRVYTIGVGSNSGGVKMPVAISPMGDYIYDYVEVRIDEKTLTEIAEITGGQYRRATNPEKLQEIYNEIDALEKQKINTIEMIVDLPEMAYLFIYAGLLVLALEMVLSKFLFKGLSF